MPVSHPAPQPDPPTASHRGETDLRLLLPALAAWSMAALLPDVDSRYDPLLLGGAGLAVLVAVLLLLGRGRSHPPARSVRAPTPSGEPAPPTRSAWSSGGVLVAAVLLTGAASTVCTVLHTADLHRGPLQALADAATPSPTQPSGPASPSPLTDLPEPVPPATPDDGDPTPRRAAAKGSRGFDARRVGVELTITGDPRTHTSAARGSAPGQSLLTVEATADRVTVPPGSAGAATLTSTPVTVVVRARDAEGWRGLLPSARVAVEARVLPKRRENTDAGAVLLAEEPPRQLASASAAQRLAGRLRSGLRRACEGLPADARALLPGLVVGDTSGMPDELDAAFHATDLVHLNAVSGANLSIVMAVLLGAPGRAGTAERGGLASLLGLPLRIAALLGAVLTLAFVTLCRPDPSVLRAAATGLVGLLALATGRPRQAVPALAGSILVLVLAAPYLARSYGFVLSALATLGLLTVGRRWTEALCERGWPHHLAGGVAAAASAQAFCAPATVLLSPRVSLVGIPCNLLAELAITPATLLGFAALAVAPFSAGLAHLLTEIAALPAEWLAAVARVGASLPGAEFAWTPGWLGTVTLTVAIVAACSALPLLFPARAPARALRHDSRTEPAGPPGPAPALSLLHPARRRARRRGVLVSGVLVLVLLALLLRPPSLVRIATGWPPAGWRLVMCSIGQGDLLVLPVAGGGDGPADTAVVVDAGPDPVAADGCLRDLGITRVALVVLTHFHADHSEGLPGVLRHRAVGAIETTTLDTPPGEEAKVLGWAAAAHVPLVRATPGEHRSAGPALSWDVLWPVGPLGPATPGPNNASIAMLVTAGGLRLALLGDLEPAAQAELLGHARPGRVDVLKVAHHGSANQDWALAAALHPRLALISCGRQNPYGHPSAQTVDNLRALGATVLRTDRSGDIAVLGDDPAHLHALVHPHEPPGDEQEPAADPPR